MAADTLCPRCGLSIPVARLGICPRCILDFPESGDTVPEGPHFKAGMKLGDKLELLDEIGRGGMGTVFKARHMALDRLVALKFLPPALADEPEFRTRFQREGRALAKLNHNNIVSIYDFGEENGVFYLVMEYLDGGTLHDRIPLQAEAAAQHMVEICSAVDYAHRQGIIHRDIKPANVLCDNAGRVKLSDFGIAKLIAQGTSGWTVTAPDKVPGTPGYVAPEALHGSAPNEQTDIFSLGVMFYELLTGKLPLGAFEPLAHPFDGILRKALANDPVKRYPNAEAMRQDLLAALASCGSAEKRAASPPGTALPPDEFNLLRAAALINSVATSVGLWALLECVRPKYFHAGEVPPLAIPFVRQLADGTLYSPARFETWPVLGAVMAGVVAFVLNALLRRHWRKSALDVADPESPLAQSKTVLVLGLGAVALYTLHKLLEARGLLWASVYFPIVGGLVEVVILFYVWVGILESSRRSRSLSREPLLWLGLVLALCPPAYTLFEHLTHTL